MQSRPHEELVDLCYEDVIVGEEVITDSHTVTWEDVQSFAALTRDRHPLHTDADYCSRTAFGRPIAHGLYGVALIEGLKAELKLYQNTSIASLGWDKVRFRAPIFPGDTLHVHVRFASKRESQSGPHGIVVERIEMLNQQGMVVIDAEHAAMLVKRAGSIA
ncbi:MaoC family dehydratase [Chelativorans xinjiangense]|uniref:MaoC family dehydratase n=1 Tax=Chelativorans xinjiangense TaxID=2681485 RepID=UPI001915E406|nr:MaoC/PaaZ C-terminal domain-containing protein [Chelativorans xinjiangense]